MNKPTVSVLMLTFNHEAFIKEALKSVIEQQSCKYNLEVLIIDDGSKDNTPIIIKKIQKEYPEVIFPIFKEHCGVSCINKNFNELIDRARGKFITFLSGDDSYVGNSIEKQLALFKKYEDLELVIADGVNYDINEGKYLNKCQEKYIVEKLKIGDIHGVYKYITSKVPQLFIQGYMVKKSFLKKIGGFDEKVIADDWVLNIRIFRHLSTIKEGYKKVYFTDDVVFKRNIHHSSTSMNYCIHFQRVKEVIDKYIPVENKKNIMKQVYLDFFIAFTKNKHYLKSIKFFWKYIFTDPSMSLLRNRIKEKF